MPGRESGSRQALVGKLNVHDEAKAVIAEHIGYLDQRYYEASPFASVGPFDSIPPLPNNLITRPELELLVRHILSSTSSVGITSFQGMGGVGKTVMAIALCHDERVRHAFPDGIIWLKFGKETKATVEQRIKEVAESLNQQFHSYTETTYRALLKDRAVLIVLDDVWDLSSAEPFIPPPGRCALLYTSRDRGIAASVGAASHEIGLLDFDQARSFLLRRSDRELIAPPIADLNGILEQCNGLILALAMIGGRLRGQDDSEWASVLTDLQQVRLKYLGQRPRQYEHDTVYASIDVSVRALAMADRKAYGDLAVLLENMSAPIVLLQALWGGDMNKVRDLARRLTDRSLATWDSQRSLRLHDLQLDYLCAEHPNPASLKLIRATVLRSLHVIDAYPARFSAQMVGRLLSFTSEHPAIGEFLNQLDANAPRPRFRPLRAALQPAGTSSRAFESNDHIYAVALSANGRCIATGCFDCNVRVWNLELGTMPRVLQSHRGMVLAVALTPDGRWVVSGGNDSTVRVWDLQSNAPPRILRGHSGNVNAVAISADADSAASCGNDGTVRVWDLKSGTPRCVLKGHRGEVYKVAMSADGRWIVSSTGSRALWLWDLTSNSRPRLLKGHRSPVSAVAISADNRTIVSGSEGAEVMLWDLASTASPRILKGNHGLVRGVAISGDSRQVVSGSDDGMIRVWDLTSDAMPRVLQGHSTALVGVGISADARWAVSAADDGSVQVWDLASNVNDVRSRGAVITDLALPADASLLAFSSDTVVHLADLTRDATPRLLKGNSHVVTAVAFSADGRNVYSGARDGTVRSWNLKNDARPSVLKRNKWGVAALAISPNEHLIVSGSVTGALRVWNLETNGLRRYLRGHHDNITGVAFSGDGRRIVSSSDDGTVRVWDPTGHMRPRVLEGHGSYKVKAVALSANGRWVFSGSLGGSVAMWDLDLDIDDAPRILEGHKDRVNALALSTDGLWMISGSDDRSLQVWDLKSLNCVSGFKCDFAITSCAWKADLIAAGDRGGNIHLLRWEP